MTPNPEARKPSSPTPGVSVVILAGGIVVVLFETTNLLVIAGLALVAIGGYGLARSAGVRRRWARLAANFT
jgi:hypothetical protein